MNKYDDYERFAEYEEMFRERPRHKKKPRKKQQEITEMDDSIQAWIPTYAQSLDPLHHERQWVINSVAPFYHEEMITDVTRLVKGGKEANVYACVGHPASGFELLAAKLYRPRMLRHLKNDALYKLGRALRDEAGKTIRSARERNAIRKKTRYGKAVEFSQWVGMEFGAQSLLFDAGADVPKPIKQQGNAVLMAYVGDEYGPAPTLNEVRVDAEEAPQLFERVMANVALMLDLHMIHGDLSAYNILYWHGRIFIIDFPQMVMARHNPHAYHILRRDITRVCDYFAKLGVTAAADPAALTDALWEPYMGEIPSEELDDLT
jgi:RIO kinase 1